MSHTPPRTNSIDTASDDRSRFVVIPRRVPRPRGVSPLRRDDMSEEAPPPPRTMSSRRTRSRVPRLQPQPETKSPTGPQGLAPLNATARHLSSSTSTSLVHPAGAGATAASVGPSGGAGAGSPGGMPPPSRETSASHGHVPAVHSTNTPTMSTAPIANTGTPTHTNSSGAVAPNFIPALSSRAISSISPELNNILSLGSSSGNAPPAPVVPSSSANQGPLPTIFTVTSTATNSNAPATHSPKAGKKNVRGTLFERRNRLELGSISLSMETFTEEATTSLSAPPAVNIRGWSKIPSRHLSPLAAGGHHPPEPLSLVGPLGFGGGSSTLKVVSYNILAQYLVSTDNYPLCPAAALTEEHRIPLIMDELRHAEADIVALSEISAKVFAADNSLGRFLSSSMNYDGYYVANTSITGTVTCTAKPYSKRGIPSATAEEKDPESPTNDPTRDDTDGVALFFNNNRFELLEEVPVFFNKLGMADTSLTPAERKNLLVKTHNVALVIVLKDLDNPRWTYVVGTSHITWRRCESQLWQLHHVIKVMERLKMKYGGGKPPAPPPPDEVEGRTNFSRTTSENFLSCVCGPDEVQVACILAGDFNMEPNHPAFEYARTGALPGDAEVMKSWRDAGADASHSHELVLIEHARPRKGSRQTSGMSQPSPPPKPKPTRAPSQGRAKTTLSTWPPPADPSEELGGTTRDRRGGPDTLRDLLGLDVNRRVVVSADNGEGESPLKTQATPEKPNTPPPPRRRDMDRVAMPPSPMKVWQRSESSYGEVERHNTAELYLPDNSDHNAGVSSTSAPGGPVSSAILTLGATDAPPLSPMLGLPPTTTPRAKRRPFSRRLSESRSSDSSIECGSPLPRRSSPAPASCGPVAPADPPPTGRSFQRRAERKRAASASFSPQTMHQLRFRNAYETYITRHPKRVTANSSGGGEGKVIDYILCDNDLLRAVSVLRLGERSTNLPSWNCPSDHFMVGAIFRVPPPPTSGGPLSGTSTFSQI